jgi:hypothetical protein
VSVQNHRVRGRIFCPQIPKPHRVVLAAGHQPAAIRADCHRSDPPLMAPQNRPPSLESSFAFSQGPRGCTPRNGDRSPRGKATRRRASRHRFRRCGRPRRCCCPRLPHRRTDSPPRKRGRSPGEKATRRQVLGPVFSDTESPEITYPICRIEEMAPEVHRRGPPSALVSSVAVYVLVVLTIGP